jgi:hypothetical protein
MVTDFDLVIKTDDVGGLIIAVPRTAQYQEKLCGICGDFDDASGNDWVIGPFTPCDADGSSQGTVVCMNVKAMFQERIHLYSLDFLFCNSWTRL